MLFPPLRPSQPPPTVTCSGPFTVSCHTGKFGSNSSSFCFFKKKAVLPSLLGGIFGGTEFLG